MRTLYFRLLSYTASSVGLFLIAVSFPLAAQALTITPVFYDSGNYSHTFTASTFTADTNNSSYCPGQPVTVSGVQPFVATCGNGASASVGTSIGGNTLSSANAPACPYVGVTMCTAYTTQTQSVCYDICKPGKTADTSICYQKCSNVMTKVCNSGATQSYPTATQSICNETDITNILNANPSWYVLSIAENPSNYQYSFTIPQNTPPGTYQIPINLWVILNQPPYYTTNPSDGTWLPVNTSLSYTVNTLAQCQSSCSIAPSGITGNAVIPGGVVQANDFNTLATAICTIWDSAYNAGIPGILSTCANAGYESSVSHGTPVYALPLDNLTNALRYLHNYCPNNTVLIPSGPISGAPIKASDFNGIRTAIEGFEVQPPKPSSADQMTAFSVDAVDGTISGTSVAVTVPYNTTVTSMSPAITVSSGATVSPASGTAENFTNPVSYTVTAQDGVTSQTYKVTVTIAPQSSGGGGGGTGGGGGGGVHKVY